MGTVAFEDYGVGKFNCDSPGWCGPVEVFLATLDCAATKRAYRLAITTALKHFGGLNSITLTDLIRYRESLILRLSSGRSDHLSPATVALHLAAMRGLLRFLRRQGQSSLPDEDVRFALRAPKATVITPYSILSEQEMKRLIHAAKNNPRDYALLVLMSASALRASEICGLRVADIVIDGDGDWLVHVRGGKGRRDRLVPLDATAAEELSAYSASRQIDLTSEMDRAQALFRSRRGGHLSTSQLRYLVAAYALKAGLSGKRVSPHSLRHTCATAWMQNGVSLPQIQQLLGHENLSLTSRYVRHFELSDLKRAIQRRVPQ
jgi:integrase/recombinase XerD